MKILEIIGGIVGISWIIIFLVSNSLYWKFFKRIKKEDDLKGQDIYHEPGGVAYPGHYYLRPPMPIIRGTENDETRRIIELHNKLVRIAWILCGVLIVLFVINMSMK